MALGTQLFQAERLRKRNDAASEKAASSLTKSIFPYIAAPKPGTPPFFVSLTF